jgi:hypothetical protein
MTIKNHEESSAKNQEESRGSSNVIHTSTAQTIIPRRSICTVTVPKNTALARQQRKWLLNQCLDLFKTFVCLEVIF